MLDSLNDSLSTSFLKGLKCEEEGLNYRYQPPVSVEKLERAILTLEYALAHYRAAMADPSSGIATKEDIESKRYYRTIGIIAATIGDMGSIAPEYNDALAMKLQDGKMHIDEEISWREKRGEKETFELANAYHTKGMVLTEFLRGNGLAYLAARDSLNKAEEIFQLLGKKQELAVLHLRRAWLEYRYDPKNVNAIGVGLRGYEANIQSVADGIQKALSYRLETLQRTIAPKAE